MQHPLLLPRPFITTGLHPSLHPLKDVAHKKTHQSDRKHGFVPDVLGSVLPHSDLPSQEPTTEAKTPNVALPLTTAFMATQTSRLLPAKKICEVIWGSSYPVLSSLSPFTDFTPASQSEGFSCPLLLFLLPLSSMGVPPNKAHAPLISSWCLLLRGHRFKSWLLFVTSMCDFGQIIKLFSALVSLFAKVGKEWHLFHMAVARTNLCVRHLESTHALSTLCLWSWMLQCLAWKGIWSMCDEC